MFPPLLFCFSLHLTTIVIEGDHINIMNKSQTVGCAWQRDHLRFYRAQAWHRLSPASCASPLTANSFCFLFFIMMSMLKVSFLNELTIRQSSLILYLYQFRHPQYHLLSSFFCGYFQWQMWLLIVILLFQLLVTFVPESNFFNCYRKFSFQ